MGRTYKEYGMMTSWQCKMKTIVAKVILIENNCYRVIYIFDKT